MLTKLIFSITFNRFDCRRSHALVLFITIAIFALVLGLGIGISYRNKKAVTTDINDSIPGKDMVNSSLIKFNNEYIKHRISCIPIMYNKTDKFNTLINKYYIKKDLRLWSGTYDVDSKSILN